jgi:aminopeptidase-like protein|tara:strand:+ start:351 stop:1613 length:1263 start_codon:yes stop_codon:yes gene_type:complete
MQKKLTNKILKKLFPITRSITGSGFKKSLKILKEYEKAIKTKKIKSGTRVFDWIVPYEWDFKNAYISHNGKKIIDTKNSNLHVLNFSTPVDKKINFSELKKKIHYIKKKPHAIPYKTSYYQKDWGFCVTYNQFKELKKIKDKLHVKIESKFKKGSLIYGEYYKKGKIDKEIIFSTYLCHPSMANNELSGPTVCLNLIKYLKTINTKYSYRILFLPETIGAISFLSKNFKKIKDKVICGFVVTCVGDKGKFSYIPSRYANTYADKIVKQNLKDYKTYSYLDRGSDERQFCSPLIDLPFCSVTRSKYREYPEYHTSLDDLNFIDYKSLKESFNFYKKCIKTIESNSIPKSKIFCEPFLQKRKLYSKNRGEWIGNLSKNIIDYISYSDGKNNLEHIAKILKINKLTIKKITNLLVKEKIIDLY